MTKERMDECIRVSDRGRLAREFTMTEFWTKHLKPHLEQTPLHVDRTWFDPAKRNADEAAANAIFNSGRTFQAGDIITALERWINQGKEAEREMAMFSGPKARPNAQKAQEVNNG